MSYWLFGAELPLVTSNRKMNLLGQHFPQETSQETIGLVFSGQGHLEAWASTAEYKKNGWRKQ